MASVLLMILVTSALGLEELLEANRSDGLRGPHRSMQRCFHRRLLRPGNLREERHALFVSTHYPSTVTADEGGPVYYQQQVLSTVDRSAIGF